MYLAYKNRYAYKKCICLCTYCGCYGMLCIVLLDNTRCSTKCILFICKYYSLHGVNDYLFYLIIAKVFWNVSFGDVGGFCSVFADAFKQADVKYSLTVKKFSEAVLRHNLYISLIPVSYTHLDVYKRQILLIIKWFSLILCSVTHI